MQHTTQRRAMRCARCSMQASHPHLRTGRARGRSPPARSCPEASLQRGCSRGPARRGSTGAGAAVSAGGLWLWSAAPPGDAERGQPLAAPGSPLKLEMQIHAWSRGAACLQQRQRGRQLDAVHLRRILAAGLRAAPLRRPQPASAGMTTPHATFAGPFWPLGQASGNSIARTLGAGKTSTPGARATRAASVVLAGLDSSPAPLSAPKLNLKAIAAAGCR